MRDLLFVQSTTEMGGAESVLVNLLSASEELKARSTVATLGFGDRSLSARLRAEGADVVELRGARLRDLPGAVGTIRRLARLARERGARVLLGNGAHPQVFAAAAAWLARAKSVYLVHMIHRVPLCANGAIDALAAASPFTLAISNSKATLEAMRKLRPRARHAVVHPGVPQVAVDPDDARRARRELGAGDGEVLFGVFGRLQRWKGQDVFVEAAARVAREIPAARFAVVGGSVFGLEPEFTRALVARAGALGLGGRIVFAGHRRDVPRLMAACDVVCHTTRVPEPFGIVVIEAMAQARPVVATRGGGPSEIIEEGQTGLLVSPDDAEALADAARTLGCDPALRARMGAQGRERVRERFTSERAAAALVSALDEVAR